MTEQQNSSTRSQLDLTALDAVLNSFVHAAQQPATTRDQLYQTFHPRLMAATQALASAVFAKRSESQFTLISQSGWKQFDATTLAEIKESIKQQYNRTPAAQSTQLTTFVATTLPVDGVEFLVVLVRSKDPDPLVEQLLGDLVKEVAIQVETFELRRAAEQRPQAVQDLAHLVQLTQNVAKSATLVEMAMQLVNDLAKITRADRVCYFSPRGRLIAVSGVSQVALKTNLARSLTRLARVAKQNRVMIESTEDAIGIESTRSQVAVKQWLSELDSERAYFKPIEYAGRCQGVVSVEYFPAEQASPGSVENNKLIARSIDFVAPIVSRAVQVQSIPGIRILDLIFNRMVTRPVRMALGLAVLAGLLGGCYYGLFLVERSFEIQAEGVLQPRQTRHIFAPQDGEVKTLLVQDASSVRQGQVLVIVESKPLTDQRIALEGELAEANQELQNILIKDLQLERQDAVDNQGVDQQTQAAAEMERLRLRAQTLQQRLKQIDLQLSELQLIAPITGQITTPHLTQRLTARPVNRGDLLMSVSDLEGEWEIQLKVPDNRLKFIRNAETPELRFRVASSSEQVFPAQIREFDFRAEATEAGLNQVRVLADFDESQLRDQLRPGTRVAAKIDCGQKNNWFLLTYELRQKLNAWLFW